MFRISTAGKELEVTFAYGTNKHMRFTECYIKDCIENQLYYAIVRCYVKDQFVKAEGRKKAFKKALEEMGLDKYARTFVWQVFKNHCNLE